MSDLWSKARDCLPDSDKLKLEKLLGDSSQVSFNELLELVKLNRKTCLDSRTKITKPDGTSLVLHDVFDKVLLWLNKFRQVGDVVANYNPVHTCLPWAAFRILLQFITSDAQSAVGIAESLEVVIHHVTRNGLIEASAVRDFGHPDLERELQLGLISFYAAVLKYLAGAFDLYESRSLPTAMKSGFRSAPALQAELDLVQCRSDEIQRGLNTITSLAIQEARSELKHLGKIMKSFDDPIIRTATAANEVRDHLQEDERWEILRWISTVPHAEIHKQHMRDIVPGTGEWLQQRQEFLNWQTSSTSSVFWLRGKLGYGKTKLTAKVIQSTLEWNSQANNPTPVTYFYCSANNPQQMRSSALSVLKSLLRQISVSCEDGNLKTSIINSYQTRLEDARNIAADPAALAIEDCVDMISDLAADSPLTMIIDGIDELEGDVDILIQSICKIVEESSSVIKVFLGGRPVEETLLESNFAISYDMTGADSEQDIVKFLENKVTRAIQQGRLLNGKLSDEARSKVVRMLSQGAGGMFLWASLQLESICDGHRFLIEQDVLEALSKPPGKLFSVLDDIVGKFQHYSPVAKDMVTTCIAWMLAAQRSVTGNELLSAIASGKRRNSIDMNSLISLCGNLIVIDESSSICSFLHLSIREYFNSLPNYNGSQVNASALTKCLAFYTSDDGDEAQNTQADHYQDKIHDNLQNYASMFWMDHFINIKEESLALEAQEMLEYFVFGDGGLYFELWLGDVSAMLDTGEVWNQRLQQLHSVLAKRGSAIHVASAFGLPSLIQYVMRKKNRQTEIAHAWVNAANLDGACPVYISSRFGHDDVLRLLLKNGATPNVQGGQLQNPLQAAAFSGHIACLKTLLDHHANHQAPGKFKDTLRAALASGHEDIVMELITRRLYEHSDTEEITNQALQLGFDSVLRIFEVSNEDDEFEQSGMNKLQKALFYGSVRAARVFLDRIDDINASGGRYGNALQAAAVGGSDRCVALLLKKGADIASVGLYGTALKAAAMMGHDKVLKCLLAKGARDDGKGKTNDATAAAAENGHLSTTTLLLNSMKPDTNMDLIYPVSLQKACFQGHAKIADDLLMNFANSQYGPPEQNALESALFAGHVSVMRVFAKHFHSMKYFHVRNFRLTCRVAGFNLPKIRPSVLPKPAVGKFELEEPNSPGEALKGFIDRRYSSEFGCGLGRPRADDVHGMRVDVHSMRLAARLGDPDIIQMLVSAGHSPYADKFTRSRWRPAHPVEIAAAYGRVEAVESLLELGSDPGRALIFATRFGQKLVLESLLKRYPDAETDLEWKEFRKEFEINQLSSRHADIYYGPPLRSLLNRSALALAIYLDRKDLTSILVEHKAQSSDRLPNLALVIAVQKNDMTVLESLLKDSRLWPKPLARDLVERDDLRRFVDELRIDKYTENLLAQFFHISEEKGKTNLGIDTLASESERKILVLRCAMEYGSKARSYQALKDLYKSNQVDGFRHQLPIYAALSAECHDQGVTPDDFLDTFSLPQKFNALLLEILALIYLKPASAQPYADKTEKHSDNVKSLVRKVLELHDEDLEAIDSTLTRVCQAALDAHSFSLAEDVLQMSEQQRQPLGSRAPEIIHNLIDATGEENMSQVAYLCGFIQKLVRYGAKPAQKNDHGYSAIARACISGSTQAFDLFRGYETSESLHNQKFSTSTQSHASEYSSTLTRDNERDLLSVTMLGFSKDYDERSWTKDLVSSYGHIVLSLVSDGFRCDLEDQSTIHFFQVACFQNQGVLLDLMEATLNRHEPIGHKLNSMGLLHLAALGAHESMCTRLLRLGASASHEAHLKFPIEARSERQKPTSGTPIFFLTHPEISRELRPTSFRRNGIRCYSRIISAFLEAGVSKTDEQRVFGFAMMNNEDSPPYQQGPSDEDLVYHLMKRVQDYTTADRTYPYFASLAAGGNLGWIRRLVNEGFKLGDGHENVLELVKAASDRGQLHVRDFLLQSTGFNAH